MKAQDVVLVPRWTCHVQVLHWSWWEPCRSHLQVQRQKSHPSCPWRLAWWSLMRLPTRTTAARAEQRMWQAESPVRPISRSKWVYTPVGARNRLAKTSQFHILRKTRESAIRDRALSNGCLSPSQLVQTEYLPGRVQFNPSVLSGKQQAPTARLCGSTSDHAMRRWRYGPWVHGLPP